MQLSGTEGCIDELEADMQRIAALMAIAPPPGTWEKIEEHIDESIIKTATDFLKLDRPGKKMAMCRLIKMGTSI